MSLIAVTPNIIAGKKNNTYFSSLMFWIRQTEWKQTSHETALNYVKNFNF